MAKKRIVLIFVVLVLCWCGQLVLRAGSSRPIQARTEPNQLKESAAWSFGGSDSVPEKNEAQNTLIRQFAIAIGFVVVLGGCALYLSKRFAGKLATARGKNISVVETIHLGPQKTLHLVEVGAGQTLLIGSTNENISILADVTETVSERLNPKPQDNRGEDVH